MKGPDEDNPRTGLADPAEAAGFNLKEADAPCCTIENFRISVHLGPRCDWNQSAARVFADWYIPRAIARFPNMKKKTAVEGFLTHAETLRSKFLKEMKKENELMQDAKRARMRERQKNLFHRRKDVAEFFPSLRHGVTMLRRLQINGMSEDDSDPGSDAEHNWGYPADVPVFRILKKRWRNPRVTTWLRILDTFYPEYLQAREKKQRKHPTQVRIRVETALYSSEDKDIVVPNLPVDAYSGTWLQRLNTFEKDKYMIREHESFHFEHNPETQS
ncbi:hypothetical protein DENSPDRAFT_788838 [Dentipellis sp. KUC8613]|nr:hypothetical protein DENSPDRAFT_788838 [Dentipellis sp. KUC8613]